MALVSGTRLMKYECGRNSCRTASHEEKKKPSITVRSCYLYTTVHTSQSYPACLFSLSKCCMEHSRTAALQNRQGAHVTTCDTARFSERDKQRFSFSTTYQVADGCTALISISFPSCSSLHPILQLHTKSQCPKNNRTSYSLILQRCLQEVDRLEIGNGEGDHGQENRC